MWEARLPDFIPRNKPVTFAQNYQAKWVEKQLPRNVGNPHRDPRNESGRCKS